MKQTLKIGVMLLALAAVAMTGVAVAQSDGATGVWSATAEAAWTGEAAVVDETAAADDSAQEARILEWLAPLVDDGTITQEQAEAVAGTLAQNMPHMRRGMGMARGLHAVEETADFLGITAAELTEALGDGSTLAEIAAANGSTAQALIDHLVALTEERLDEAVAAGRITADQKAELLADATERITGLVNGDLAGPPMGCHGGMGFGHHRGMGGPMGDASGGGLEQLEDADA